MFSSLEMHDLIGGMGAAVLLVTYFLLQINRISAGSMKYSVLNGLGSASILVSLTNDFNFAAFVIEVAWFVVSCVGALVTLRQWRMAKKDLPNESTP